MSDIKHIQHARLAKEFLEGIKYFYDFKTKILTKYAISDMDYFKKLQSDILKVQNIEELKTIRKKLMSVGMKSVGNFMIFEKFYDFLINNANALKISELKTLKEDLLVNFLYEKSLQNKSSSIILYKTMLGDLFRFLDKKCGYAFDFSLRGMKFNKESSLPVFLPETKFLNFIEYLKNHHFKKDFDKKNRLILLIVALSGCRSAEVRNLKLSDFKITRTTDGEEYYSLKLRGKGNKERMAAIKKQSIQEPLKEWLECDLRKRKYNQEFLFCSTISKNDTTKYFLKKTLKELNLKQEKCGLHMLRHSFASFVYERTKDITLTQNLLGHSSIETTKIYVHSTTDFSKQVINLF
ncbi:tyrosine-type recombinase/integrase [Helicobacter cappadocius]|uniref:Site-specific integrase n=1 Tax=Helicobacter cappadocius TaxID=3063998 RepID=A0AA90PK74_9HELI|nr:MULTISPECIES: site-specific integrase [unclassified Helicobacter]MDO7253926.1 site-specific integrase [Helicobacter sp. faydin-H75]MDP2539777.1 site-specific integrase [Helicobacter sp. faydin-H76]